MAKFDAAQYDPADDSSPGSSKYRKGDDALRGVILIVGSDCACGCTLSTSSDKTRFRQGHDAKLKGILQRAFLADEPVNILDGEGGVVTMSAYDVFSEYNWHQFVPAPMPPKGDSSEVEVEPAVVVRRGGWYTIEGTDEKVQGKDALVEALGGRDYILA